MAATYCEIGTMITRNPRLRGGRPIIAGTGACVRTIAIASNKGYSPEEIAADRSHLTLAQIHAALAFYHANKSEIDADIEENERAYDEGARSSGRPILP